MNHEFLAEYNETFAFLWSNFKREKLVKSMALQGNDLKRWFLSLRRASEQISYDFKNI